MSIRTKLLCVLLLVGATAIVVTGFLGYQAGKRGLTQTAMNQLTGIRRSKAYQIESYFRTTRSQVRTLRHGILAIDAFVAFRSEFQKLDRFRITSEARATLSNYYRQNYLPRLYKLVDTRGSIDDYMPVEPAAYLLQFAFIASNPFPIGQKKALESAPGVEGYSRAHALYHGRLRSIAEELGYYDLFLVDAKTGAIIYSVQKEVDLGTSLYNGPYSRTGLARAVTEVKDSRDPENVVVSDFEMYEPSFGAPAAFAAAAIRERSETVGVLAIQLTNSEIDRVMSGDRGWEREGLGRSGDSGIVGSDYKLRSNARGFLQREEEAISQMRARKVPEKVIERIRAYRSTVLQQEVRLPSVEAAIRGEEGTRIQIGSAGKASLVSYMPLKIPGLHWMIGSRIDLAEALAPVEHFRRALLWWGLLAMTATTAIALLLTKAIVGPISRLASAAERVAHSDYKVHVPIESKDELGTLSRTFNDMVDSIREKTETIEQKNRENERLLLNILPEPIAVRLRNGETTIADSFAEATVLFADIVGFTTLSMKTTPSEMVGMLNELFTRFDEAAIRVGVEKIKTIGDAYMAVAGLPSPNHDHARRVVMLGLEMLREIRAFRQRTKSNLAIRIGINSGPVVAGIIGSSKFIYDLWGDTVNVASRMESHGVEDRIQVTRAVYEQVSGEFTFEERGFIEIKGRGTLETWLLHLPTPVERGV